MAQALQEVLSEILDDDQVQEEIDNLRSAMDDQSALSSTLQKSDNHYQTAVTMDMVNNSAAVADVLRQIWARMDSGWVYGTSEGSRIDMGRASMARTAEDYDSIYDEWEPGQQENSGMEVVILADQSSSTRDPMVKGGRGGPSICAVTSRNIWELMNAMHEIEAAVTVLTFHDYCHTLYDRDDRVNSSGYSVLSPRGGTEPSAALFEARRIFNTSEQPNKLLICLTDGEWPYWSADTITKTLNSMEGEVVRSIILLGGMSSFSYASSFDVVAPTNGEILSAMSNIVASVLDRAER
jgi:hypothetical protein